MSQSARKALMGSTRVARRAGTTQATMAMHTTKIGTATNVSGSNGLVPVSRIASVVVQGELLHLVTLDNEEHTINDRLKDLEPRLDPGHFIRLGRGALVAVDTIVKVTILPGGTHRVSLRNGQELPVSRIQARTLRERLLKL